MTLNGSTVLYRSAVSVSAGLQKGVQGSVVLEVTLDAKGNVRDARVLSGPAELRRISLVSVLAWHFTEDAANTTREVGLQFTPLPASEHWSRGPDFDPALVVLPQPPAGPFGKPIPRLTSGVFRPKPESPDSSL